MLEPRYLGDGVYAQQSEDFPLILCTGTHELDEAEAIIYLEPSVLLQLMYYVEEIKEKAKCPSASLTPQKL